METTTDRVQHESPLAVLAAGLVVVLFGAYAVWAAIAVGFVLAFVVGAAFHLIAWRVHTRPTLRSFRLITAALGVVAVAGAVLDLLT